MAINKKNPEIIHRDYIDNFSIKDYAKKTLVPKYFDTEKVSDLNIGLMGYVTELISDGLEDTYNSISILHDEMYPNRAKLPSSIMSYASLFHIDGGIARPSSCDFLLVLNEDYVQKNFEQENGQNVFYIDKDTKIVVEDRVYSFDYDIMIRAYKNNTLNTYVYSAQYVIDKPNSISIVESPYIRINKGANGYLGLYVRCQQYSRRTEYEQIINNTKINLPSIKLKLTSQIAGFDIFYKSSTDKDFNTKLKPLLKFSSPLKEPFCFYSVDDLKSLTITFGNRNNYFQPDFNSECKIILYLTKGKEGDFDVYTGKDVTMVTTSERYPYNDNFFITAKVMGSSSGGKDAMTDEELQALAVEGFRTATVYSTDNDLEEYFNNYKYRFGNECKFIKSRDDVVDRLYNGYLIMRKDDFIYPTNTVYIDMNLDQFARTEETRFVIQPGTLFAYKSDGINCEVVYNKTNWTDLNNEYRQYLTDRSLDEHKFSIWKFLKNKNIDLKMDIFNTNLDVAKEQYPFLYVNPFLISINKSPNLVGLYLTTINQNSMVDFIDQNLTMFEQFILTNIKLNRKLDNTNKYTFNTAVIPAHTIPEDTKPVEHFGRADKVKDNNLRVIVVIKDKKDRELCFTELIPTNAGLVNDFHFKGQIWTDNHVTNNDKFRLTNGFVKMVDSEDMLIPMKTICDIYVLWKKTGANNRFSRFDNTLAGYDWTNKYSTTNDPLIFIKPLNLIKSHLVFKDWRLAGNTINDVTLNSVPLLGVDVIKNEEKMDYFNKTFIDQYINLEKSVEFLKTSTHIDLKFYNTYGKSKNFIIGDNVDGEQIIDTINISIRYYVWVYANTDKLKADEELRHFIKKYLESINEEGTNNFFNSNMLKAIETRFAYVHHIKFIGINNYDPKYQTVKNNTTDLDSLTKEEHLRYVPEVLVVNYDNIHLTFYDE